MDVQPVDTQAAAPLPTLLDTVETTDLGSAPFVPPTTIVASPSPDVPAPAAPSPSGENGAHAFAQTASQLFTGRPSSGDVTVSIRVAQHPEQIITVFRDAEGNEIQQVPSEVVVRLAEFFDQQLGSLLDRNV